MHYKKTFVILNLFLGFCSLAHAASAPSESETPLNDLPPEVHHEIVSNLGKKDALALGKTDKYFNKIVKENTQCPVLTQKLVENDPPKLATATTLTAHEFIDKDITSAHSRKWTIKYLHIGFSGTFLKFMQDNNVTHLEPLSADRANELLGHKYRHNPETECVYDLHNRALDGATLVLKIKE